MATSKPQFISDFQEFDTHDANVKNAKITRTVESIRLGLTILALLASLTILGTAGDALSNYNQTSLGAEYIISLWPSDFDLRPTTALVICSAIVFVASAISLITSSVPVLRNRALIHSAISFLAPSVALIAGLIGASFFYGVNASTTKFSLQAWSCQWSPIDMDTKPHWGTLCRESKAALYLTVMLIPLEVFVLGAASWSVLAQRKQVVVHERKGSPGGTS